MPSMPTWLARHGTIPAHERLRGRATMHELRALRQLATLSGAEVRRDVENRIAALMQFAERRLPYYARLFDRCRVDAWSSDPLAELEKTPVLRKHAIREHAAHMTFANVAGGLIAHSSGGTTGDTLRFHVDRVRQAQSAAAQLFMRERFGVRPGDGIAYLWGSPIETRGSRVRRWRDALLNELVLNAFEMSPACMDAHLDTMRKFKPTVLYGYPSAIALLARHAATRRAPAGFPWLRLIVMTGEEVSPDQAADAREAFACQVVSEYGSRETGVIAHDCPAGRMHVLCPHIHVEVTVNGVSVPDGTCGDITCTTLNTRAQPFIRYLVGDVGEIVPEGCDCGLPFPTLRLTGGKITGFIRLADGSLCHGAVTSHILRDQNGVVEFKTHQREVALFDVQLVVNRQFNTGSCDIIRDRYRRLFGPQIDVRCRIVDRIAPDPSGKRRYVVSDVVPNAVSSPIIRNTHPPSPR